MHPVLLERLILPQLVNKIQAFCRILYLVTVFTIA